MALKRPSCGEITLTWILTAAYRFVQLILACTVIGLYGVDLHRAHKEHKYSDGKWVFAVTISSISAVSSLLYIVVPFLLRIPFLFIWDVILFIIWIALFGLFGNMYIRERPEGDKGIERMKSAVWVDLVNAILWLFSAVGLFAFWWTSGRRTRWTGRAAV